MNAGIIAFTEKAYRLGERIKALWIDDEKDNPPDIELIAKTKALPELMDRRETMDIIAAWFREKDAILFLSATGIAVRCIAPYLKHKSVDPAVLVMDEDARFCISLLSGHLGGANALAVEIAGWTKSTPVITTATDEEGMFSVDLFAKENHLIITDFTKAKEISAKVLRGEKLRIVTEISQESLKKLPGADEAEYVERDQAAQADILISERRDAETAGLLLIPVRICIGIGSRKGVSEEAVRYAVEECLSAYNLREAAVEVMASIDLKKSEPGILAFSYRSGIPFVTYTAEELAAVDGSFSESSFVRSVTGVANVCERAAARAAGKSGRKIAAKTIYGDVTISLWAKE